MSYYCRVANAERSVNNGVRVWLEVVETETEGIVEYHDVTLQYSPEGDRQSKQDGIAGQIQELMAQLVERRKTADENVGETLPKLIGLRYPLASEVEVKGRG